MESNWRYNVWDLGMAASDWRLAARSVLLPWAIVVNPTPAMPTRYRVYFDLGGNQVPLFIGDATILPPGLGFPYGEDVDPD